MRPIGLQRWKLAQEAAATLNRIGRQAGRFQKAFVIVEAGTSIVYKLHHPGVDQNDVLAILRLLLQGYRNHEITPIMIQRAKERPHWMERKEGT